MEEARKQSPAIAPTTDREAVAVLVHGTYAASESHSGDSWWQAGSSVAKRIESLLPKFIRQASEDEVFHWSGENSERARSKAATKLVRHLRSLEAKGCDYHLVGHSHGGSVIWKALKLCTLTNRPLVGLRSWTTVGTPFLHHRSRGAFNVRNLLGLIIGLVLLMPAVTGPKQLITTLYNVAINNRVPIVLPPDEEVGYTRPARVPVLAVVEHLGIPVDRRADGIYVGSFDPGGDVSIARYFFASPEGLFLLVLMAGLSYFFIHVAVLCISPAVESYRVRLEQRLRKRAFATYGSRWLGVWSPDDEAINGLRATLDISVSFVGKIAPREVVYFSDILALVWRPYYWLLAPVYNRFVHPALDHQIRNIVIRSAQGSDRPTATLVDVSHVPIPGTEKQAPSLPSLLNAKLLSSANSHAHDLVPKLRRLIAQNSFVTGLESFGTQLSGKELIHTAYFDQDEVLKVIAANMSWESETDGNRILFSMSPWLQKWFLAYKEQIVQDTDAKPVVKLPVESIDRREAG